MLSRIIDLVDVAIYMEETDTEARKRQLQDRELSRPHARSPEKLEALWVNREADNLQRVVPSKENADFIVHIDPAFQLTVEEVLPQRHNVAPPVSALLKKARLQKKAFLSICPHSQLTLDATIRAAKDKKWPVVIIYSRDQVDSPELGGGHVFDWDQEKCVRAIRQRFVELGY